MWFSRIWSGGIPDSICIACKGVVLNTGKIVLRHLFCMVSIFRICCFLPFHHTGAAYDSAGNTQALYSIFMFQWLSCDDIAIFPLFFLYSAPFRCSRYTPLHHRPTIHRFSSISSIAVAHRTSRLRRVDRRDLIAYMKRIRRMTRTDAIETHSRRRVFHNSAPPGFHM